MKEVPLSIIVPVSKDIKIIQCLESIDVRTEIVVVLNNDPSDEVVRAVQKDERVVSVHLDNQPCNLAKAFNRGVEKAKNEKILLTNSDCVFPAGLIESMSELLDEYEVVKSRVEFRFRTFDEFLVARLRYLFHHVYNDSLNLFGPGLGFRKKIIKSIGGYLFDEDMAWGEDGELSRRIHTVQLDVTFTGSNLVHAEEKVSHDLTMASRIGSGKRAADTKNQVSLSQGASRLALEILLDKKKQLRIALQQEQPAVAAYYFLWKIAYVLGYLKGNKRY